LGWALRAPGLKHVQPLLLDGELSVLHVLVVALEGPQDLQQLLMDLGQPVLHLRQVARRPDTRDDVLALCVGKEISTRLGRAGDLVTRERDPGARRLALVAEHHLLDVDRRSPVVWDLVEPAVGDRALTDPRVEHGPDREPQLLVGLLGELLAGVLAVDLRVDLGGRRIIKKKKNRVDPNV
jgi:hypothetical protein